MTSKQTQRWFMRGTAALSLAGLLVLAWVLFIPARVPAPDEGEQDARLPVNASSADAKTNEPTLEQLQVLGSIDLRRPLKDPPPIKVTPPPMQAKLLGTIYESTNPEQSLALFRLGDGTERLFKAGDQFNEPGGTVVIKRVGDQHAWVEYRDEQQELKAGSP